MIRNLKLIFIHGISDQTTNYSHGLFQLILAACRSQLAAQGHTPRSIDDLLSRVVHHEILWANLTTDLTNRYLQLAYQRPNFFWNHFTRSIDPLAVQIMQYIKDKGDKTTGPMDILAGVHASIARIFTAQDLGESTAPGEGHQAIIIGHSLGSVIGFDYVMGFRPPYALAPDITVQSFITMGSPIPLFISAMGHPDSDLVLPDQIKKWVNIRSPRDGVARSLPPFFRHLRIQEHQVHTRFSPTAAHTAYWHDPQTARLIAQEVLSVLLAKS